MSTAAQPGWAMNADSRPRWLPSPATPTGAALATLVHAAILLTLGVATQEETSGSLGEAAMMALVLASPLAVIVMRGHFGLDRWRIPSLGAFLFLTWQAGLGPSMLVVSSVARRFARFGDDAVIYGRVVFVAWFVLYALALGGARGEEETQEADERVSAVPWFVLVLIWAVTALVASRYELLSFWVGSQDVAAPETGSLDMALLLFYYVVTGLLAPVALLVYLKGPHSTRLVALAGLAGGVFMLFILSSRRVAVFATYLCLLMMDRMARRVRKSWLVAAIAVVLLIAGPLVWSFRRMLQASSHEDVVNVAVSSVVVYATSEEGRIAAHEWGEQNLQTRLDTAGLYFGATGIVLDYGANQSPSMLEPLARWIPTVLWQGKNDAAEALSAKRQLMESGRFPPVDIPVSPIAEFVFQFGLLLAPLGGALYALVARGISALGGWAMRSVPAFAVWTSIAMGFLFFDGGTKENIMALRETLALGAVLWAVDAIARRRANKALKQRTRATIAMER